MRYVLAIAALLACTAASPAKDADTGESLAGSAHPQLEELSEDREAICRDRVHAVRDERGLPRLERESADPEEPLLIAAVDHRIDGCSVLVMKYDSTDVRPIPKPDDRAPLLRRVQ